MANRYDAFISYRHCESDREWAKWLIRALETYRPPRTVVSNLRRAGQAAQDLEGIPGRGRSRCWR